MRVLVRQLVHQVCEELRNVLLASLFWNFKVRRHGALFWPFNLFKKQWVAYSAI